MSTAALAQASLGELQEQAGENNGIAPDDNVSAMDGSLQNASLKRMFTDGISSIATQKHRDLFKDLETRQLTQAEEDIIQQRVALQRKLLEAYELREHARKVAELREVCPQLSDEAASRALHLCDGREDDAAAELVSNPAFVSKVMSMCQQPVLPPPDANPAVKLAQLATADGDAVFVGAFRGKGYSTAGAPKCTLASLKLPLSGTGLTRPGPVDVGVQAPTPECEQECEETPTASERAQLEASSVESDAVDASPDQRLKACRSLHDASAGLVATPCGGGTTEPVTRYGLAVESSGKLRPVRDSEIKRATAGPGPTHPATNDELRSRTGSDDQAAPHAPVADDETRATDSSPAPREATASPQASSPRRLRRPRAAKAAALAVMLADAFFSDDESASEGDGEASAESMQPGQAKRKRGGSDSDTTTGGGSAARVSKLPSQATQQRSTCSSLNQAAESVDQACKAGVLPDRSSKQSAHRRSSRVLATTSSSGGGVDVDDGIDGDASLDSDDATESRAAADSDVTVTDDECQPAHSGPAIRRSQRQRAGTTVVPDSALLVQKKPGRELGASMAWKQRCSTGGGSAVVQAVSASGHTNRGRVKQKSHKSAELVDVGQLWPHRGWCNAGYIFPLGFASRTLFRSSVALDQLCVHDCYIQGTGGTFWPAPTFTVVARDRPDEPLVAKSCTGCWTGVLKRINAEIETRRAGGEALPPPPKTAIAGPEYFGLNQVNIQEAIEQLDPEHLCLEYWAGKAQRERAAAGLPLQPSQPAGRVQRPAGGGGKKARRRAAIEDEDEPGEDEGHYASKWSGINRAERYRKRREEAGEDTSLLDDDNPVPDLIDPITLEPVIRPAISPYGHVMGIATWKAVLAERKTCPFTKQPLSWEGCRVLTKSNYQLYADRIIR